MTTRKSAHLLLATILLVKQRPHTPISPASPLPIQSLSWELSDTSTADTFSRIKDSIPQPAVHCKRHNSQTSKHFNGTFLIYIKSPASTPISQTYNISLAGPYRLNTFRISLLSHQNLWGHRLSSLTYKYICLLRQYISFCRQTINITHF